MKYADIQKSIEAYFNSNWTATEVTFENAPFETELYSEFVRLSVRFGDTVRRSIGDQCYRIPGILIVQIFVRPGIGIDRVVKLSDIVAGLFTSEQVLMSNTGDFIQFDTPSLNKITTEYMGWIQANVSFNFYHDLRI